MKKSKLFFLTLLISMVGVNVFAGYLVSIDGLSYDLDDNTLEARLYRGTDYSGDIIIPSSVSYNNKSYSVTSIGHEAFYNCKSITSVTVPSSVTSIESGAFQGCSNLTSVILPDGLKSISRETFDGCSNLKSLTIPNSVERIGENAFYGCGLTSLTIGSRVADIEAFAFCHCSNLNTLTIPSNVKNIGYDAFCGCSGLESIVVESGNTVYDSRESCNAIIETSTNTLVAGCKFSTIPNNVTTIGSGAFYYCDGLTSIAIPNSVTSIEGFAFSYSGLISVTIPNSVTYLGVQAFCFCSNLSSVTLPDNDGLRLGDHVLGSCPKLTSITTLCPKPISVGANSFDKSNYSATLVVPDGCKSDYVSVAPWNNFTNIMELGDYLTGVQGVTTDQHQNAPFFDLQGRLVAPQKGIYIKDGKKVLVK